MSKAKKDKKSKKDGAKAKGPGKSAAPSPAEQPRGVAGEILAHTKPHADEVLEQARGQNRVELFAPRGAHLPDHFKRPALVAGHVWEEQRPLERQQQAAPPMVPFPHRWNEKHGRYTQLKGPGGHVLRLLRARPK